MILEMRIIGISWRRYIFCDNHLAFSGKIPDTSVFFWYLGYLVFLFRLAVMALGIIGLVKFNEDTRVLA